MKIIGRLAVFAVFGMATGASAIVISGGPTTTPPGGGSCSVTSNATCNGSPCQAPDGTGGVTITCSSLNVAFYRHLYYGINNAPPSPNGDSMQSHNPVTGTEIFRFASITGSNQINYGGTTSIFNAQSGTTSSQAEANVVVFQTGTGSLVTDGTITALNNTNGDVQYLWQVTSNSFTTTVNVNAGGSNAIPTVFDPTHTTNGTQEIDHVSLAFYFDTCGNGVREGAEQCDNGASNGQPGSCCDANCNFVGSGTLCRASAGTCDVQETCTGGSGTCPADGFLSSTTVCRGSAGVCDVAEKCTGSSAACPGDSLASSTVVCRPPSGVCDQAENCTGSSVTCPGDGFLSSATVCRPSAGPCDVAENCSGSGTACPADDFQSSTTVCRSSAGVCDVQESCTGSGAACPADGFQSSTTVCRGSAGVCDVAENCTGTGAACPTDGFVSSTTVCRASAGTCDVAESCTGTSADCPPDSVQGAFVTCRPSVGPCDQAENCTGSTAACPADAFQPTTVTCRASAGVCDVAETCTGTGAACPADALSPSTVACRPATDACDVAESCTGTSVTCPADAKEPNGTACDDSNSCTTSDSCQGGVCTGTASSAPACQDHYLCYKVRASALSNSPTVHLVDDFEDVTATSLKARTLCAPGNTNGSPVTDDTTHLVAYSFKQSARHTPRTVTTHDEFGTLSLTTIKPETLYVPSNRDFTTTPAAPDENAINVNHYKCYKVKITPGTLAFSKGVQATVADEFNSPPKVFNVRKPRHLCNPVSKNSETIKDPNAHFVCYQVKAVTGQPKHVRRSLFVANQFGPGAMLTITERELCIPSTRTP